MDGNTSRVDGDDVDWDTDDELEIENFTLSSSANPGSGEVTIDPTSEAETKLMSLVKMGYNELEVSMATERCGIDSSLVDLTDFISAAQISKAEDGQLPLEEMRTHLRSEYPEKNKNKLCESSLLKWKRIMGHGNQIIGEDADAIHLPNPMIGFGTSADLCQIHRSLPEAAAGPPYFYHENVASTPKGVWSTISRFLYDVKPEFVDPKYFCAAARKRGYVHKLPI